VLDNIGEREPDRGRDAIGRNGDTAFQGLITNAGAFLNCDAVRSGKQIVWCFYADHLLGSVGPGKRKIQSAAAVRSLKSEITNTG
jgi:hypothetical protein